MFFWLHQLHRQSWEGTYSSELVQKQSQDWYQWKKSIIFGITIQFRWYKHGSEGNIGITCVYWLWYSACFLWKRESKAFENPTEDSQIHHDVSWYWYDHRPHGRGTGFLTWVWDIYVHIDTSTNDLHFKLCCSKQDKLETKGIPPRLQSLKLHSRRATFQAFVWFQNLLFHHRWIMNGKWLKMRLP